MPDDIRTEGRDRRTERALEFLNAEPTEDLLTSRLEEVSGDPTLARLGPALYARRAEIGSFNDIADLKDVDGLSDVTALINGLNRPTFEFESETLELVQWAHGNSLHIETPEAFGSIERRAQGIRILGRSREKPGPAAWWSWAHISISVPTYVEEKQFYVRAVLFDFVGWPATFGIKGKPLATPYEIEVWDGHVRVADQEMPALTQPSNHYLRVPVQSSKRLRYGLSVSFSLFVYGLHETENFQYRVDLSGVGVELVTRTGQVLVADFS